MVLAVICAFIGVHIGSVPAVVVRGKLGNCRLLSDHILVRQVKPQVTKLGGVGTGDSRRASAFRRDQVIGSVAVGRVRQEVLDAHRATFVRRRVVAVRTNSLLEEMQANLNTQGRECQKLSRQRPDNRNIEGLRLATMHRVKGLEFKAVFMACVNEGLVPLRVGRHGNPGPG